MQFTLELGGVVMPYTRHTWPVLGIRSMPHMSGHLILVKFSECTRDTSSDEQEHVV